MFLNRPKLKSLIAFMPVSNLFKRLNFSYYAFLIAILTLWSSYFNLSFPELTLFPLSLFNRSSLLYYNAVTSFIIASLPTFVAAIWSLLTSICPFIFACSVSSDILVFILSYIWEESLSASVATLYSLASRFIRMLWQFYIFLTLS